MSVPHNFKGNKFAKEVLRFLAILNFHILEYFPFQYVVQDISLFHFKNILRDFLFILLLKIILYLMIII